MASSISAARAALHDRLAASAGLVGVQVVFGVPDAYEEQEVVAMLGVGPTDEDPATLGRPTTDERFTIRVACKVHDPAAKTGAQVDARCFAIADVIREVVADNRTLGGVVVMAGVSGQDSDGAVPAKGGGWVCFNTVSIACRARIT